MSALRAPFPWFGGKRRVAPEVWERFGDVPNYVEPFFGSGAVLLGRQHLPPFNRSHNPSHVQARAAYFDLQAARAVSLSATERKSVRRGLILTAMSSPLAGHDITLFSSAVDASALPGELDTTRIQTVKVSTPGRLNSGRAVSARFAGGMLLIGVIGKYLPEDVVRARAQITVIPNRKPAGFELKRILLNENDHMAGILGSRTT